MPKSAAKLLSLSLSLSLILRKLLSLPFLLLPAVVTGAGSISAAALLHAQLRSPRHELSLHAVAAVVLWLEVRSCVVAVLLPLNARVLSGSVHKPLLLVGTARPVALSLRHSAGPEQLQAVATQRLLR